MARITCACCGKQIVSYPCVEDKWIAPGPPISLGFNAWCCSICGIELNENGLFPEEEE